MIVVRNVFQLKFGKAKEAKTLIKEQQDLMKKYGGTTARFMTDLTGEFYILEMEMSFENLAEYEKSSSEMMGKKEFDEWYQKFVPLVRSGKREIYSVVN
ncbi:MAG: NIPSNAP family protein [Candidatus Kryptoniota bacterium]